MLWNQKSYLFWFDINCKTGGGGVTRDIILVIVNCKKAGSGPSETHVYKKINVSNFFMISNLVKIREETIIFFMSKPEGLRAIKHYDTPPSYGRSNSEIAKWCVTFPLKTLFLTSLERASGTPAHLWINVTHIPAQAGESTQASLKGQ